jgi:hypothetical protein
MLNNSLLDAKSASEKLSTILSGVAGEYFVAAELSRRGYIASITLRNSKGLDILCSNENATRSVGIQVKTNRGSNRSWLMNEKSENYHAENLFYVFVNLNDNIKPPDYFIVPSKVTADHAKETHATWLKTPGKNGQAHIDTKMRKFSDPEEKYLNKWEMLGL